MITLTYNTTTAPDFPGWHYYVETGRLFDAAEYAEACGMDFNDISALDIHAVQDACGHLDPGEWLRVDHEILVNP